MSKQENNAPELKIDLLTKEVTLLSSRVQNIDITANVDFYPFSSFAMIMNPDKDDNPFRIEGILWSLLQDRDGGNTVEDYRQMHCCFEYSEGTSKEINSRKLFTLVNYNGSILKISLSKSEFEAILSDITNLHKIVGQDSNFDPVVNVPLSRPLKPNEINKIVAGRESQTRRASLAILITTTLLFAAIISGCYLQDGAGWPFALLSTIAITLEIFLVAIFTSRSSNVSEIEQAFIQNMSPETR